MLTVLNPATLSKAQFYSQGVVATRAERLAFISGQVGIDAQGRPGADIGEQTRLAIANLHAVLAEAGMGPSNLAKVTIYLTDAALMQGFAEAGAGLLPAPPPATTLLIVTALGGPGLLVEIEAIAVG